MTINNLKTTTKKQGSEIGHFGGLGGPRGPGDPCKRHLLEENPGHRGRPGPLDGPIKALFGFPGRESAFRALLGPYEALIRPQSGPNRALIGPSSRDAADGPTRYSHALDFQIFVEGLHPFVVSSST